MKKFRITLRVTTTQDVYYDAEAESRAAVNELLEENCVEDIATPVDEEPAESYAEEVIRIEELP